MMIRGGLSALERYIVRGSNPDAKMPFVSLGAPKTQGMTSSFVPGNPLRNGGASITARTNSFHSRLDLVNQQLDSVTSAYSVIADLRSTLQSIRSQVELIRDKAAADVGGILSESDREAAQTAIDNAVSEINRLADSRIGGKRLLNAGIRVVEKRNVTGADSAQISDVNVNNIEFGSSTTLAGNIVSEAAAAELTYGSGDGLAGATATFTVRGNLGSRSFSTTKGESLADVRDRINSATDATGVVASLEDGRLVFRSQTRGDAATVEVTADTIDDEYEESGRNPSQITDLTTQNLRLGTDETLSGSVLTREEQAVLQYQGVGGLVVGVAKIKVEGNDGRKTFNVSAGESLESLRDRINAETANTGVVASLSGDVLTFQSVKAGSDQKVKITRQSGVFAVTGGDGNGLDYGLDDTAVINGVQITGAGGNFTYSNASGDFTLKFADGFTGDFDPVRVQFRAGTFQIQGGNGNGSDTGSDGVAVVNGTTLTSATNDFRYSDANVDVTLSFAAGFTGEFQSFTVTSTPVVERSKRSLGIAITDGSGRRQKGLQLAGLGAGTLGDGINFLADLATGQSLAGLGDQAARAVEVADAALAFLDKQASLLDTYESEVLAQAESSLQSVKSELQAELEAVTGEESDPGNASPLLDSSGTSRSLRQLLFGSSQGILSALLGADSRGRGLLLSLLRNPTV